MNPRKCIPEILKRSLLLPSVLFGLFDLQRYLTMSTPHIQKHFSPVTTDDEIDLRRCCRSGPTKVRVKHHNLHAASQAASALTRKPVWEGISRLCLRIKQALQVVDASQSSSQSNARQSGGLGDVAGESSLETEVKILGKPSLKPIYDFVKTRKAAAGEDVSEWVYTDWVQGSLAIELVWMNPFSIWPTRILTNP